MIYADYNQFANCHTYVCGSTNPGGFFGLFDHLFVVYLFFMLAAVIAFRIIRVLFHGERFFGGRGIKPQPQQFFDWIEPTPKSLDELIASQNQRNTNRINKTPPPKPPKDSPRTYREW